MPRLTLADKRVLQRALGAYNPDILDELYGNK